MTGSEADRRQAARSICKDFLMEQARLPDVLEELRSLYPLDDDEAPEIARLAWRWGSPDYEAQGGDEAAAMLAASLAYE